MKWPRSSLFWPVCIEYDAPVPLARQWSHSYSRHLLLIGGSAGYCCSAGVAIKEYNKVDKPPYWYCGGQVPSIRRSTTWPTLNLEARTVRACEVLSIPCSAVECYFRLRVQPLSWIADARSFGIRAEKASIKETSGPSDRSFALQLSAPIGSSSGHLVSGLPCTSRCPFRHVRDFLQRWRGITISWLPTSPTELTCDTNFLSRRQWCN